MDEVSKQAVKKTRSRDWSTWTDDQDNDNRSTVVLNITKPYVNAFASKIIDMRLAVTGRAWAFSPTPIPELEEMKKQNQVGLVENGQPVMMEEDGQQRQATPADKANEILKKARQKADKAQKQVDDWMVESHWDSEARQAVDDMARIGTGVLKGPFPQKFTYTKYQDGKLVKVEKIRPTSKRISARNLFPDPACGENIHNGDYVWDWDGITKKRLKDLKKLTDSKGRPIYIAEQIDLVLKEGPRQADVDYNANPAVVDPNQKVKPFQIWYYYGTLEKDDIEAAGCTCDGDDDSYSVIVAMVNDHVIRAGMSPLDNGKFPFDVAPCSRREGHWAGVGIAKDLDVPSKMIIGANRSMLENAGLSAKPIIALMQGLLVPADGNNVLYGGKVFIIPKGTDITEAKNALFQFQVESRQEENMNIIQFALKMAENVTGLPMILQGQQGQAPDRVGVVQILDKNASTVANRVTKMYDDNLLEPHVGGYYDWLMEYSEDEEMKGDYTIDVLPPPDIVADRQSLIELSKAADNPKAKVDFSKFFAELAKSNKFDPTRIQYSDEEWAKIEKQQPAPPIPVAVAQIREQGATERKGQEIEAENKRLGVELALEKEQAELDRQLEHWQTQIQATLDAADLDGQRGMNTEDRKAAIAQTTAKIMAQIRLSMAAISDGKDQAVASHEVDLYKHRNPPQVLTPPSEPAGKAAPGSAYQA
ncbi:MAG: hypothetical protein WC073_11325 [Sterolibacterium sp.]